MADTVSHDKELEVAVDYLVQSNEQAKVHKRKGGPRATIRHPEQRSPPVYRQSRFIET